VNETESADNAPDDGPVWRDARRTVMIGTGMALAGAFLYGANIPAARAASQAGMTGADLIFYRSLIMLPLLAIFALAMRQSLAVPPGEIGQLARLGIASGLTASFYLSALDHLPVPITVVLFYTFPLIVMVVSNRLAGRWLDRRQLGVFAVAFVGLVIAVGPSLGGISGWGVMLALLGACSCAALFIIVGTVTGPPMRTLFWVQVAVAPIALGFAMLNGGPVPLSTFANAPLAIAIAMGAYMIAFVFQLQAAKRISPSRAGILFLFEPVTAIVIAGLVLGETMHPAQIAGVVLILGALAAEVALDAGWLRRFTSRDAPQA
jgi:drug/metabolite transporter (DMT)-like permease